MESKAGVIEGRRSTWAPRKAFHVSLGMLFVCCVSLSNSKLLASTITVYPGANLQNLVNQYPSGTTFSLAPGTYRLQSVVPKAYDVFLGQSGATLSGAALLTSFSWNGAHWVSHVNVTQKSSYRGVCQSTHPACALPEDLFFDDIPKTRVTSLSSLGPGKWYLDYSTGNVYMSDSPSGHRVEISLVPHAFTGSADSVRISSLVIEKYASIAGDGAVQCGPGAAYWNVEWNEVRYNHGVGIRSGDGMWIHNNKVHHNGQLGIGGAGEKINVQNNEIYYNNYAGYSYYWEAGGVKFSGALTVTIQYNYAHDNAGPGFWTDVNSQFIDIASNQATRNKEAGIFLELSYNITVSNNHVWNDGFNPSGSSIWWGAGILDTDSSDVDIYGNQVTDCVNGIGGILASRGLNPSGVPYLLKNLNVHDNTITQVTGKASGIVKGSGFDNSVYSSWNNHFQSNVFVLTYPTTYYYFYWLGTSWTLATWNANFSLH